MKKLITLISFLALLLVSCKQETYYNITTKVEPEGSGSIVVTPSSGAVLDGTSVSFLAKPNGDYVFSEWSGGLSGEVNPQTVTVSSDLSVTAKFTLRSYPLTITVEGEGTVSEKVISTRSDYTAGTVVELTANPSEHWLFDHWEGDLNSNTSPIQVTVTSAKTVKAVFVPKMYDLTVEVEGEGSVSETVVETKSGTYQEGTMVELTAHPAKGWSFDHWDGDLLGSNNSEQITVQSEMTIKAVFVKLGLEHPYGSANCYIISAPGEYSFPAVKGNSDEALYGKDLSAMIVWETFNDDTPVIGRNLIQDISYSDGRIIFSIGTPFKNGNALVALKNDSGVILWSWHLWLCEGYDAMATAMVFPNNAGTAMDRDIGALTSRGIDARGLLFQWGRKDPFIGWSGKSEPWFGWYMDPPRDISASSLSSNKTVLIADAMNGRDNTLSFTISNPTVYIYSKNAPWDWYTDDKAKQNNSLWDDSGKKTVFDPCPPGWKVPKGGKNGFWATAGISTSSMRIPGQEGQLYRFGGYPAMTDYWSRARGREFIPNGAWFPASGFRVGISGDLGGGGHYACYWTSTADEYLADAMHFGFFGEVYPSEVNVRTYGFSIRCVKEEEL